MFLPKVQEIKQLLINNPGNIIPIYYDFPADLITPIIAYLRVSKNENYSFLFESVLGGEKIGRYSFIGSKPYKVIKNSGNSTENDPLIEIENQMKTFKYVPVDGVQSFSGGAVGYISYDCIRYFESKIAKVSADLDDSLKIPDCVMMFCDSIIVFDHLFQSMRVISHLRLDLESDIDIAYEIASKNITDIIAKLENHSDCIPIQPPITLGHESISNVGKEGYEEFVSKLKCLIKEGEIIQAVPSQRICKKTDLHPVNAYRTLRRINPSPYMFYVNINNEFQLVGASPEMLVKVTDNIVYTHPIAGTRKRGKTVQEDDLLAQELLNDIKERSEHIMLVDLGRNDVNRVCDPDSVKVDSLMQIERYSHVMHIVSNVSGKLRKEKTIYDAFRSIFPAGTVSGAPKIRAMEIIYELEKQKRGIYAGAVGHFSYSGDLDTCIAIRTMVFKDDNFDSFTWNIYQYLSQLGANVKVFRNDEISLEDCISLNPRNIILSPGPGHPRDSGITYEIIRHFSGKVPILGVCLGEQAIFEVFGGIVKYAGEIIHGKTSPIEHDGLYLFKDIPQRFEVTRYHSLAGDPSSLPSVLKITSKTDSGIIMGIRHKKFIIEGVQFHPESIASEHGLQLFANFLAWTGGSWADLQIINEPPKDIKSGCLNLQPITSGIDISKISKINSTENSSNISILEKIKNQRTCDVSMAKLLPGNSQYHLEKIIARGNIPPPIDMYERIIHSSNPVAILAEIKRASPSKGDIDLNCDVIDLASCYANAGAAVISVLTEPKWFKGHLIDMLRVRQSLENFPNRPAILRKDFIIDEYQILEARCYGADSILLIVSILNDDVLLNLLEYSRILGMEPLVEVATEHEMKIALKVGAKIIGVNNRDLHTFSVDMNRTSDMAHWVPKDVLLIALSGIQTPTDVYKFVQSGASGVLVGEALMKSQDKFNLIQSLQLKPAYKPKTLQNKRMIKVCGMTRLEDVQKAIDLGYDMIGFIFAESPRKISPNMAKKIIDEIKTDPSRHHIPLFVGVFSNHGYIEINSIVKKVGLDIAQLHGDELSLIARLISVPVIKVIHVLPLDNFESINEKIAMFNGSVSSILLDTGKLGGSGKEFDWDIALNIQKTCPIIVAGGLNPSNIKRAIQQINPYGVDVCSGLEESKGIKDHKKLEDFFQNATK